MKRDELLHQIIDTLADAQEFDTSLKDYATALVQMMETERLWCEPMDAGEGGWSDWTHPIPGYRMQCCDCGLVHEAEFEIVERNDDAPLNPGESDEGVIVFRMRRHGEEPIHLEEVLPGMRYEFDKIDREAVMASRRPLKGKGWVDADGKCK